MKIYKTLWGHRGSYTEAARDAVRDGYDGIEGPVPATMEAVRLLAGLLEEHRLDYIAEVATAGGYVPDRRLPLEAHLSGLAGHLQRMQPIKPRLVSCLGGCDAWPEADSLVFFKKAMHMADHYGQVIAFETHRGRSLFNPWITRRIVERLPEIRLTGDLSHWCVVCEGLQETEEALIRELAPHMRHLHCRVGYAQGPQVPDPSSPVYAGDLARHLAWWKIVWTAQAGAGLSVTTATPEFGPDGYDYRDPGTGETLIDPAILNRWMAARLRQEYGRPADWISNHSLTGDIHGGDIP